MHVVESNVVFRSCIEAKKPFATVGFTSVCNKAAKTGKVRMCRESGHLSNT